MLKTLRHWAYCAFWHGGLPLVALYSNKWVIVLTAVVVGFIIGFLVG